MKRFIAFLLAVIYLSFSTGVTLHQHYCMGQFTGASLWHETGDAHHCARCGMLKKSVGNDCCGDLHVLLKTDQNYVVAQNLFSPSPQFATAVLPLFLPAFSVAPPDGNARFVPVPNKPPDLSADCPRYLRHRCFLI
ncbi:MAG: hypothetical protein JST06_10720 [Bacteroidetes bacterium]|nr:hypothetical protein [Bacteroidota bacterium]MBS1629509.1 hypothetical protein [Bacteroidota bacterium]